MTQREPDTPISVLLCGAASHHSLRSLLETIHQCGVKAELAIYDPSRESMSDHIYWFHGLPDLDFTTVQFQWRPVQTADEDSFGKPFTWITSDALLGSIFPEEQIEMVEVWTSMIDPKGFISGTVSVVEDTRSSICPSPAEYAEIVSKKAVERFDTVLQGENIAGHLNRVTREWWENILSRDADRSRKMHNIGEIYTLMAPFALQVFKTAPLP